MTKLSAIGVGLMAGSLCCALKKNNLVEKITGIDKSLDILEEAADNKIIDDYTTSLIEGIQEADMIILGTPVEQIESILEELASFVKNDVIILDVGSTKRNICHAARSLPEGVCFIGGHPMTGSELSGVRFADSELFLGRPFVLTPVNDQVNEEKLKLVKDMIVKVGAKPVVMSPDEHDFIMASISHLPHFLAFVLVDSVILENFRQIDKNLYAGGFKDTTRVSMGDAEMWSEIFIKNKDYLKLWLEKFNKQSDELIEIIEKENKEELIKKLESIKNVREELKEEV